MNKVYAEERELAAKNQAAIRKKRSKLKSPSDVQTSKEIQSLNHLMFDKINSVQFCVDSAVGLPMFTTATRVTARLLGPDRRQIGENSAPSFSFPESDAYSPLFDLHMSWRGEALQTAVTVVLRIDTLERPSLEARCLGFACLKLCVDENGLQPFPGQTDNVRLNAGQFLIPILHGKVPSQGYLTEELMCATMPQLLSGFLSVRLFDPAVESQFKRAEENLANAALVTARREADSNVSATLSRTSVCAVILEAYPYGKDSILELHVRGVGLGLAMKDEIASGTLIDSGERKVLLRQLTEWIQRSFPPVNAKITSVDIRYAIEYEERAGTLIALDMLYNMPPRPHLLRASKLAGEEKNKRGMFNKFGWDNRICAYKTVFRYLPGSSKNRKEINEKLTDVIIDDASMVFEPSSKERCPVFSDEFSTTANLELSPYACLLVIVTAVDIFTSSAATSQHPVYKHPGVMGGQGGGGGSMRAHSDNNGPRSSAAGGRKGITSPTPPTPVTMTNYDDDKNEINDKIYKLRGLAGLHLGNNDPTCCWWGIVPLLLESPFEKPQGSGIGVARTGTRSGTAAGLNSPGGGSMDSRHSTPQKGELHGKFKAAANVVSAFGNTQQHRKVATRFVNMGTHQIALFEGNPPRDLVKSANPMAWLAAQLNPDLLLTTGAADPKVAPSKAAAANSRSGSGGGFLCFGGGKRSSSGFNPMNITLSAGASAIVNIAHPRLKAFTTDSISRDPTAIINDDALSKLLKVKSLKVQKGVSASTIDVVKFNSIYRQFQVDPAKHAHDRTFREAVPENVFIDTLWSEVNDKFVQMVSETEDNTDETR